MRIVNQKLRCVLRKITGIAIQKKLKENGNLLMARRRTEGANIKRR
jgi:hypothetical protein